MTLEKIDYQECSRLTGLPMGSLYALVHNKRIPHFRLGRRLVRFCRKEIEEWLESQKVLAGGEAKKK